MNSGVVYRKTSKGSAELSGAVRSLEQRLRPLLILVDGQRDHTTLAGLAQNFGLGEPELQLLNQLGYIEPIIEGPLTQPLTTLPPLTQPGGPGTVTRPGNTLMPLSRPMTGQQPSVPGRAPPPRSHLQRLSEGKKYLVNTATEFMGLRAYLFVLRVEKCATVDELRELLPQFEVAIAKRLSADQAAHCRQMAESILLS
jgi:hypothetical protein